MAKRVLVTGGAGFIGRWVVKAFLQDTKADVLVLDNFSNGMKENLDEFRNEPRLVEVLKGDISREKTIADFVQKVKPDLCVHLAAQIIVQSSIDDPRGTFDSDIKGTFFLLEACRAAASSFVFMSTCMVYDLSSPDGGIDETHPVLPRSPYAGAKLSGEHLAISYYHAYGMPVTVMRPFNTYGPHQKASGEGGVISIFLTRQLKGEDLPIYGTGRQTRDFLYVEDCANFVLAASTAKKARGLVLNASTGNDISVNDLASTVIGLSVTPSGSKIKHIKHIHPQSEIMKLCGNCDKAKSILGWKPKVSLEQGLGRTRDWLKPLVEKGNTRWL